MSDTNIRGATVSGDTRAMMLFEANKKSLVVAYLLWFFLNVLGGHRFYCGRIGSAILQLALTLIGVLLTPVFIGWLLILIVIVWAIIDAFLLPGWIRDHNSALAKQLAGQ